VIDMGGSALILAEFPAFLTPELQVLIWSVLIFFGLLGLLWKYAWGPIMHAVEEREHKIQKTIDDADARFKEADARLAEYEKRINASKDDAAAIIAEGKRDAEKLKADIQAEANAEAGRHDINTSQDQRTGAPDKTDDAVWQSASQNVTTNGPRLQSDKHHARAATLLHHRIDALTADERARGLVNASRDRSPRHSIPLLI